MKTHELEWEKLPNGYPDKSKPTKVAYQIWCKGTREAYLVLKHAYK